MNEKITVVRSKELRGRHGTYDVIIDGSSVGALQRGESITRDVATGEHTVLISRDDKHTSPQQTIQLAADEHITLYASLISERAAYVRSPPAPATTSS